MRSWKPREHLLGGEDAEPRAHQGLDVGRHPLLEPGLLARHAGERDVEQLVDELPARREVRGRWSRAPTLATMDAPPLPSVRAKPRPRPPRGDDHQQRPADGGAAVVGAHGARGAGDPGVEGLVSRLEGAGQHGDVDRLVLDVDPPEPEVAERRPRRVGQVGDSAA